MVVLSDLVFVSPVLRSIETAAIAFPDVPLNIEPGLLENHWICPISRQDALLSAAQCAQVGLNVNVRYAPIRRLDSVNN